MNLLKKYKIDPDSGDAIFLQLKNIILAMIENDILKVGDKIPSKSAIIKTLGISANPCNKAIAELIQDGILIGHKGKGVYVRARYTRSTSIEKCISLLCTDSKTLEHFAFSETVNGIIETISPRGYNLTFNFINPEEMSCDEIHDKLGLIQAAGIIIPHISGLEERHLTPLAQKQFPAVCIGKNFPSVSPYCVYSNIEPAVKEFVSKLKMKKKEMTLALIGGPFDEFFSVHKRAYLECLEKAGYRLSKIIIKRCPFELEAGRKAMLDIIEEEDVLPDLIIAEDDYVACGAISALHSQNIQINEKSKFLASGGFLKKLYPLNQCSSICLNHRGLGTQAAGLLIKYINRENIETENIYVPSSCIWV